MPTDAQAFVSVVQDEGEGRLPRLVLRHPAGGRAEVYLHGAHVAAWTGPSGDARLFLSRASRFAPGASIRGGVPVIFPQFADTGPGPRHGFARTMFWEMAEAGKADGAARVRLVLADTPATRAAWPHPFRAELIVTLTEALTIRLAVRNTGAEPCDFTCALHTYLRVADVRRAEVLGLGGARYHDKVGGGDAVQPAGPLRITGETDRVYQRAPGRLVLREGDGGRAMVVEKEGFADAVVWNPWVEKARALDDLAGDEYLEMLCIEPANAAAPVRLAPGEEWTGTQRLLVEE